MTRFLSFPTFLLLSNRVEWSFLAQWILLCLIYRSREFSIMESWLFFGVQVVRNSSNVLLMRVWLFWMEWNPLQFRYLLWFWISENRAFFFHMFNRVMISLDCDSNVNIVHPLYHSTQFPISTASSFEELRVISDGSDIFVAIQVGMMVWEWQ